MKNLKAIPIRYKSRCCLLINLILYTGFALADGPVWCRDSESYTSMDATREPLYCTFLWLMRNLFGDNILVHGWDLTDRIGGKVPAREPLYLMAAIVVQSAIAAVTVWYLASVCWRIGKQYSVRRAVLYALAAHAATWGVALLNRFGAKRSAAYEQSIMTEGLGISFYILFILFLLQYITAGKNGNTCREESGALSANGREKNPIRHYRILCGVMMTLCALLHKQLAFTIILFGVSRLITDVITFRRHWTDRERRPKESMKRKQLKSDTKGICFLLIALPDAAVLALCVTGIFFGEHIYNLAFHDSWSMHTGNADKIDSTLLYTVTGDDADLFDDAKLKSLFLQIEDQMEGQHLRYADVPENADWTELGSHYADAYDVIGFEVLDPLVEEYVLKNALTDNTDHMAVAAAEDEVCRELEKCLLRQNPARLIHLWIVNFRKGFVNTVLKISTVLNWTALFLWMAYICLLAWQIHKRNDPRAGWLAGLVLLGTAINAAVVGAIIFPQTRYMIYNMALFYVSGVMLLGSADFGMDFFIH